MKHGVLGLERHGMAARVTFTMGVLALSLAACAGDDDSTDENNTSVRQADADDSARSGDSRDADDSARSGDSSSGESSKDVEDGDSSSGESSSGESSSGESSSGDSSSGDSSSGDSSDDNPSDDNSSEDNSSEDNPSDGDSSDEDGSSEVNSNDDGPSDGGPSDGDPSDGDAEDSDSITVTVVNPLTDPQDGPPAGYEGGCDIPQEAGLEDASSPDQVVGDGTPESCTADAFIESVAAGGVITFDCGAAPVTITLDRPAKVFNDASEEVVIDGEGKVTLSGGGRSRILYMNTCDEAQHWTTDHCQDQDHPRLTVQNLTFVDADSKLEEEYDGGGAIWVRGGRFKIVNSRFFNNSCAEEGPDVGGAAVRVFSQYQGQPVYVVNSTFGGAEGFGNVCSNGGGISSIDVSWTIINSLFSHNRAIGNGGNPAESGTPGGGSGGAIYNDGNTMTLSLCGSLIEHNQVQAYGSGIFFVSNDHSGTMRIVDSIVRENTGGGWNVMPGISMHDDTKTEVENSTIE